MQSDRVSDSISNISMLKYRIINTSLGDKYFSSHSSGDTDFLVQLDFQEHSHPLASGHHT